MLEIYDEYSWDTVTKIWDVIYEIYNEETEETETVYLHSLDAVEYGSSAVTVWESPFTRSAASGMTVVQARLKQTIKVPENQMSMEWVGDSYTGEYVVTAAIEVDSTLVCSNNFAAAVKVRRPSQYINWDIAWSTEAKDSSSKITITFKAGPGFTSLSDWPIEVNIYELPEIVVIPEAYQKVAQQNDQDVSTSGIVVASAVFGGTDRQPATNSWQSHTECPGVRAIILPPNALSVAMNAFTGCSKLETLVIPNLQKSNGDLITFGDLFGGFDKIPSTLKNVVILGGTLSPNAFNNAKVQLENLVLGAEVTIQPPMHTDGWEDSEYRYSEGPFHKAEIDTIWLQEYGVLEDDFLQYWNTSKHTVDEFTDICYEAIENTEDAFYFDSWDLYLPKYSI